MSIEYFTNNMDCLADDYSREEMRKWLLSYSLEQNEFNTKKRRNEYLGTVISNYKQADFSQQDTQGKTLAVKIRLDEAQEQYLPFYGDKQFSKKQSSILHSCHQTAISRSPLVSQNGEKIPEFGHRVNCHYSEESPDFYGRMRDLRYEYPTSGDTAKYIPPTGSSSTSNSFWNKVKKNLGPPPAAAETYANKWGLKPKKAKYYGAFLPQMPKGTTVYNGYGVSSPFLLAKPDSRYFLKNAGGEWILKDFLESFNAMAEAFYKKFNKKLPGGLSRDFRNQLRVRAKGVANKSCAKMTSRYGGTCKTATPGSSNHGWGAAVDIRIRSGRWLNFKDPEFKWLVDNAEKKGFKGIKWTWLGSKLRPVRRKKDREAWHWEPIPDVLSKIIVK